MTEIAGNLEDKYHSANPLFRQLVDGYIRQLRELLCLCGQPTSIVEVGTGEGEIAKVLRAFFPSASIEATDISEAILATARDNLRGLGIAVRADDAEALSYSRDAFDLVVCCEVLEHLRHPQTALQEIRRVTGCRAILGVPREPIWRALNCLRGKYLTSLGNTPGHLNHWSAKNFVKLVEAAGLDVVAVKHPFPWTMVLVEK